MATVNLSASDSNGSINGSGTVSFKVPPGGTISIGAADDKGNITANIKAAQPITIDKQNFTLDAGLTDNLKNGQIGTEISLTYKPSDLASFQVSHDFGNNSTAFTASFSF